MTGLLSSTEAQQAVERYLLIHGFPIELVGVSECEVHFTTGSGATLILRFDPIREGFEIEYK